MGRYPQPERATAACLYGLTLLLAVAFPFETIRPFAWSPWLEWNDLKLLVALTAVVWALDAVVARRPGDARQDRSPLLGPALVFLALAGLSAILAPADRTEAMRFVGRFASGLYALFLAAKVASTPARTAGLLWATVLGAGLSAGLGLAEAGGWRGLEPVLGLFKTAPTRVGGELRVSGSFQYATIASMYLEMAIPLALAVAATARGSAGRWLATAVGVICTCVVVLTLTRAGLVSLVLVFVVTLAASGRWPAFRAFTWPTVAALLTLVGTTGFLAFRTPGFGTRLLTENDAGWYAATYAVPESLALESAQAAMLDVEAHNTGQAAWTRSGEHPFALAYRWVSADGLSELAVPRGEIDLPRDVGPGQSIRLQARIAADLPPGNYRLTWGMLQRNVLTFAERGSPDAETRVDVTLGLGSAPTAARPVVAGPRAVGRDSAPPVVPRRDLWGVALRLFSERPLLGVGPDNFRHVYGTYLGLETWDTRLHANNLYLELLADLGVLGTLAFAGVVWRVVSALWRRLRADPDELLSLLALGVSMSLVAFFVHGLFDYFLEFTPVYLLFWLVLGLGLACSRAR